MQRERLRDIQLKEDEELRENERIQRELMRIQEDRRQLELDTVGPKHDLEEFERNSELSDLNTIDEFLHESTSKDIQDMAQIAEVDRSETKRKELSLPK
jgi:hypothetical protein